jgi:hypothetical protein
MHRTRPYMHSLVLPTLQKSTFAMSWCNDEGTAEINDVMLLLRHDAHVHVPPMGASDPVYGMSSVLSTERQRTKSFGPSSLKDIT